MPVLLEAAPDGTLVYVVDHAASALPAVRGRDILAAWDSAREAARCRAWDDARAFRLRDADGNWTSLRVQDPDARCWAGAVDRALGIRTIYGVSVCLRLLALVNLLARAPWAAGLVTLDAGCAEIDPALLRLAAEARLTDDARFDEARLRARLQRRLPVAHN